MDILPFKHYLFYYIMTGNVEYPLSHIKFWANTLFIIKSGGINIQMPNGHFLTVFDCFMEMEDAFQGRKFEGGRPRAWWEQYQYLRGLIKKPRWIE